MMRMNYVKATKAALKLPAESPEIKLTFLKRVVDCVKEHSIPPEQRLLVLNMCLLVNGH